MEAQGMPLFLHSYNARESAPATYEWLINDSHLNAFREFSVAVHNMTFPNTVYPINTYNNLLYLVENGGATVVVTIPINNYTGAQYATALETALNAAGALVYTVTYDAQSLRLTVSVPGPDVFEFVAGANDIYSESGFIVPTGQVSSLTGPNPVMLSGTNVIELVTNFSTHTHSSSSLVNVINLIPVPVSFGGIVFYQASVNDEVDTIEGQLHSIRIQFFDMKRRPWPLPSNADWTIGLRIVPFARKQPFA